MQAHFLIRLQEPSRLAELERLFRRWGSARLAGGKTLLVTLPFTEPCSEEQARDEAGFAIRAWLPGLSFELEPVSRSCCS